MATIEEYNLAYETWLNLRNLFRDLRDNATIYKRGVETQPALSARIAGDASEYRRRVGWQDRVRNDPALKAKLDAGLVAMGLVVAEIDAELASLDAAVTAQETADTSTIAACEAVADQILATVPKHERVFQPR